jgi:proline iminopeptidase
LVAAWLDGGALLLNAPQLEDIPAVIFHCRLDLGSPADVACALHDARPGSRLIVVDDSGHTGSEQMATRLREELEALADRR